MSAIHILTDEVARQIAAGEVVDRPHSVLRELLDNAIDAGAQRIQVEIAKGGLERIRVLDDGAGMNESDLRLCTLRHATSKIVDHDDLTRIRTLGFRGEALASIGSCSVLSLTSRQVDSPAAYRALVRFGRFEGVRPFAGIPGTTVEVSSLFHELPARRRFLKSQGAETALCRRTFIEKALPHPAVGFELSIDEKSVLRLPASDLIERVAVAGGLNATDLTAIDGGGDGLQVNAIVARPEHARRDRSAIHVYLNRRRIADFGLIQAVEYGYKEFLPGGLHPVAFIFVDIKPDMVDFNVHPAKREVHLQRPGELHHAISATLQREVRLWQAGMSVGKGDPYGNAAAVSPAPSGSVLTKAPPSLPAEPLSPPALSAPEGVPMAETAPGTWLGSAPDPAAPVRYLGQAFQLFLVAEVDDHIYFVDQHAAHERVLYERLRRGSVERQKLIVGPTLELSPEGEAELRGFLPDLERCGFRLQDQGGSRYTITEIPVAAARLPADHLIRFVRLCAGTPEDFDRDVYSGLACRLALKGGEVIDNQSGQRLIENSFRINPQRCPHGRPLWFEISRTTLEDSVGRPPRQRPS